MRLSKGNSIIWGKRERWVEWKIGSKDKGLLRTTYGFDDVSLVQENTIDRRKWI